MMRGRSIVALVAISLGLLLAGCNGKPPQESSPPPSRHEMPLALASPLFTAGYEIVGYYDFTADNDRATEALAVLTLRRPTADAFTGHSYVLLFGRRGGVWSLTDTHKLDGINARAELQDLTGDGLPELLVLTEEVDTQLGDFVAPILYIDHLSVLAYTPGQLLAELATFSSSLSGEMHPHSKVSQREEQPVVQTTQDLPPVGNSLWRPYRVETFAWDGQRFASVHIEEQRRISPVVSWLARRNGPWAAVFLAIGGTAGVVATMLDRRSRLRGRWLLLAATLIFVTLGIGVGAIQKWLCVPALVLIGLAAFGSGRRTSRRFFAKKIPHENVPVSDGGADSPSRAKLESSQDDTINNGR